MVSFRNSRINIEKQTETFTKNLKQNDLVQSLRTLETYRETAVRIAQNMKNYGMLPNLSNITKEKANEYLTQRANDLDRPVLQKTVDLERQTLQRFLQLNGGLQQKENGKFETLPVTKSLAQQLNPDRLATQSRAYSDHQINAILDRQTERNAIPTLLSQHCGLRAHEMFSLRPLNEQSPSNRVASDFKFHGLSGAPYTVVGKGGLIRTVIVPHDVANRLEKTRLDTPKTIVDRGVIYKSHYDISGGKLWSRAFSKQSEKVLGVTYGAHGLRHAYAQERMASLQNAGLSFNDALRVTSQELGHFRPEITLTYLR